MKYLKHKDESFELTDQEASEMLNLFASKNKGTHFIFKEQALKFSMAEIINAVRPDFTEKEKAKTIHIQKWHEEQKQLKEETPEDKAFRCYRCYFAGYYLLRVGYTNFLGEGWKYNSKDKWWKTFDIKFAQKSPDVLKRLTNEMIDYFEKNPKEAWCDRQIYMKYLPEKTFSSPLFDDYGKANE